MNLKNTAIPSNDCYGWARLCQVIGNFFGGSTSIGIDVVNKLDCNNYDNGVYIIDGWKIVDRKYFKGHEQMEYDLQEMLLEIDKAMPEKEQIGEYLKAKEVSVEELNIGDTVFIKEFDGKFTKHKVMGFGRDEFVNGRNVYGNPYVDLYGRDFNYDWNINNYILADTVKVADE